MHIQGYIGFEKPTKFGTVLQWLKDNGMQGVHIEMVRGTYLQNYAYCTKTETRAPHGQAGEFGDFGPNRGQGARTDLLIVVELIKETGSLKRAAEDYPTTYVRNYRGLAVYKELVNPDKRRRVEPKDTKFLWIYGATGDGKTKFLWDNWPEAYDKNGAHKWWDGYDGQTVVFINEYRRTPGALPYSELLKIMDVYPYAGEKKGSTVQLAATTVVVTCSQPPWLLFSEEKDAQSCLSQMNRRCQIGQVKEGRFVEDVTSLELRLGAATRVLGLAVAAEVGPTATPSGSLTETDQ